MTTKTPSEELQAMPIVEDGDVHPEWRKVVNKVNAAIVNGSLPSLLADPNFQGYLFMNSQGEILRNQTHIIQKFFTKDLYDAALKDPSDAELFPEISFDGQRTTHNSVHHLYHMARYVRKLGEENLSSTNSVVEWGGGYGNFCKVFLKAFDTECKKTYTIIDLPEMCILQAWYLRRVFGEERVNLVTSTGQLIDGKINIVPNPLYKSLEVKADLFVSTWALSESPKSSHVDVAERNFFGASKFLFGFHQCGDHIPFYSESTHLGFILKTNGCKIEDMKIIPGINYYAFK